VKTLVFSPTPTMQKEEALGVIVDINTLKTSRFCYIAIVEPCPNYHSMTNTSIIGLEFFF
jgi:hypothetical protein